jgi:hypothetical protein
MPIPPMRLMIPKVIRRVANTVQADGLWVFVEDGI